jgi:hypothetical protein
MALAGVASDRRGARTPVLTMAVVRLRQRDGRERAFKTPGMAQGWFEWVTRGRIAPLVSLFIFITIFAVPALGIRRLGLANLFRLLGSEVWPAFALGVAPPHAAMITGMLMIRTGHKESVSGLSAFALTRPVSTRGLAAARLRMGVTALGSMYLVLALMSCAFGGMGEFLHRAGDMQGAEMGCIVTAHIALCWTLLWLALPLAITVASLAIILSLVCGLAFHMADMQGAKDFFEHGGLVYCLAVATLFAAGWAFVRARRRGLVSVRCLCVLAVVWPLLGFVLRSIASEIGFPIPYGTWESWESIEGTATAMGLALLPLLPFATVALSIERARHR